MKVAGVRIEECSVKDSKKKPLWLAFINAGADAATRPTIRVIFKSGDDLRQDQLTLQILTIMKTLWLKAGLDLMVQDYKCVSTGKEVGMIEVVEDAETLATVVQFAAKKRSGGGGTPGSSTPKGAKTPVTPGSSGGGSRHWHR